MRSFEHRTVKKGRVKIQKKEFFPPDSYDGRFEGQRLVFAVYYDFSQFPDGHWEWTISNKVYFWGCEEDWGSPSIGSRNCQVQEWLWWKTKT